MIVNVPLTEMREATHLRLTPADIEVILQSEEAARNGLPARVIIMPALGPAVMVPVGVKVTVTVVATFLTGLPSVMARFEMESLKI